MIIEVLGSFFGERRWEEGYLVGRNGWSKDREVRYQEMAEKRSFRIVCFYEENCYIVSFKCQVKKCFFNLLGRGELFKVEKQ